MCERLTPEQKQHYYNLRVFNAYTRMLDKLSAIPEFESARIRQETTRVNPDEAIRFDHNGNRYSVYFLIDSGQTLSVRRENEESMSRLLLGIQGTYNISWFCKLHEAQTIESFNNDMRACDRAEEFIGSMNIARQINTGVFK